MKVLVGEFVTESNANIPTICTIKQYDIGLGEDCIQKMGIREVFERNDVTLIPSIYANAGAAGVVEKSAFTYIEHVFIDTLKKNLHEIDGIFLMLHGASEVEALGSGDHHILKELRKLAGPYLPIAIVCDPHGNLCKEYAESATILRSYRESPHTDADETMEKVAEYLVDQIPEKGRVLTQCFGETIVGMMCRVAQRRNRQVEFYHAETRPYLQGARLTSSVCHEMGFSSTVITDNMVAYAMENKGISLFTSAADTIAGDGHIANKVGTMQIAILAKYFHIPYFVTGIPDADKRSKADIIIEERDPQQVLCYRGINNTLPGVQAIYPSFDITPPYLIDGVITDKGVYSAYDVAAYFEEDVSQFY